MQSLPELVRQANLIEQQILDNEGEITPEIEAILDEVSTALIQKADGYSVMIDRSKLAAEYWSNEAKKLQAVSRSCKNFGERLKDRIKMTMLESEKIEISGSNQTFKLSKIAPRLVIDDQDSLPPKYLKEIKVIEVNKESLKADLLAGVKLAGAAHLEGGYRLNKKIRKG